MPGLRLHEVILPTDRWSARAVSPIDIRHGIDTVVYGEVVIVHPGWGKAPERHAEFLMQLADSGFLPIGVDTRYGYADRQTPQSRLLQQSRVVGSTNPHFNVKSRAENRWEYRRPTVMLDICDRLGIVKRSYVGHSEGGRIVTLGALSTPEIAQKLILVNAAGTGNSSRGPLRLARSNINNAKELTNDKAGLTVAARSALGSIAYTLTHPRRTIAEKTVIQSTDTWSLLDQLRDESSAVTVFHAQNDELISFDDSQKSAQERPWIEFIPTSGNHNNIYQGGVRSLIIQALSKEG